MKCPYCDTEKKLGYVEQTRFISPLEWTPSDAELGFKALFKKQSIRLTTYSKPYITMYYCEKCGKFIVNKEDIGD